LNQTLHSQPLVFIIEYALGCTWLARGLRPEAMIGYSIGEYAAACLAEVVAVEDALTLITRRAAMIQALPHGVMLAVPLAEAKLTPMLGDDLSLCIVSTPSMCVLGGPEAAVAALEARLKAAEIVSRRLPGTHAFHSQMLKSLHAPLTELISGFSLAAPKIPYLSNVTGAWITPEEAVDPSYWARHTWQTVRFADGLGRLLEREGRVFVEAGPGQSLGSFVLQHPAAAKLADKLVLPSLRNRYERQDDEAFFLSTLGKLWLAGVETVSKT
jgi:acyl transferase domain-containing protein